MVEEYDAIGREKYFIGHAVVATLAMSKRNVRYLKKVFRLRVLLLENNIYDQPYWVFL